MSDDYKMVESATVTNVNQREGQYGTSYSVELNGNSRHFVNDKNYLPKVGDIITAVLKPKHKDDQTYWNLYSVTVQGQSIPKNPAPQQAVAPVSAETYTKKDQTIAALSIMRAGITGEPQEAAKLAKMLLEEIYNPQESLSLPKPENSPQAQIDGMRASLENNEQVNQQSTDVGEPEFDEQIPF